MPWWVWVIIGVVSGLFAGGVYLLIQAPWEPLDQGSYYAETQDHAGRC